MNKLNGYNYLITKVEDGKAEAQIILRKNRFTKEAVLGEDTVTITAANAICFRVVFDPNPKDIPDMDEYSVLNGKLMRDGKPVTQQGEIVIEKIMAAIPLKLVLLCKTKTEGVYYLKTYLPAEDKFGNSLILESDTIPQVDMLENGDHVFAYSKTETRTLDNGEVETWFKQAAVSFMDEKGCITEVHLPCPIDLVAAAADAETVIANCKYGVDEKTRAIKEEESSFMVSYKGVKKLPISGIDSARKFFVNGGGFVFRNQDTVLVTDCDGAELFCIDDADAFLKGYMYLVDEKCDDNGATLLFANSNYKMKRCNIIETDDRGRIIEVVDYTAE